jgi:Fur family ferric uptake transcriptional regulator
VHGLEDPVTAQGAEVVGAQDRGIDGDGAAPQYGKHAIGHDGDATAPAGTLDHVSDGSLAEMLRAKGLRLTAQRQLVLEAVHELGHATPDQVHAKVSAVAAGVNITTVYRTLELLEELGLVTHAHLSHGAPTYHSVGEAQHVHLVCRACGGLTEMPSGMLSHLAQSLDREYGFLLDIGHVALFGVCMRCGERDA